MLFVLVGAHVVFVLFVFVGGSCHFCVICICSGLVSFRGYLYLVGAHVVFVLFVFVGARVVFVLFVFVGGSCHFYVICICRGSFHLCVICICRHTLKIRETERSEVMIFSPQ